MLTLTLLVSGSIGAAQAPSPTAGIQPSPTPPPVALAHGFPWAGQVVSHEPLPKALWLPSTARAMRLRYVSTAQFGLPVLVSGAIFIPEGPVPDEGWPIVSWAHGTVGVADACAPSTAGRSARDVTYLTAWLQAGYAVVSTDYRGLGTPGPHPYLDGEPAARDVIDMVRAARRIDRSLGPSWFAIGQSQGAQAALFTGAIAKAYAPELDFRGAIATAPPTQWRMLLTDTSVLDPDAPANPFVIDVLAGLAAAHPFGFAPNGYLTDLGRAIFKDALRTDCFPDTAARVAGLPNRDVYDMDADERERLIQLLELEDIPIAAYDRPVYIAQGTADTVVYPPASEVTADQLREAGTDVTFAFYPDADHGGVLAAALPDLLAWAEMNRTMPAPAPDGADLAPAGRAVGGVTVRIVTDTFVITGDEGANVIVLRAASQSRLEVDTNNDGIADFGIDRGRFQKILVSARGGNDVVRIDESNGVFTDTEETTLSGGAGHDVIIGGSAREIIRGDAGNDTISGGPGDDGVLLGEDHDSFTWMPGDGSDSVHGEGGSDSFVFVGAPATDVMELTANGMGRFFLRRNPDNVFMDVTGMETVMVVAGGGSQDRVTVHDLAGTGVAKVLVDLASTASGTVVVDGTAGDDAIKAVGSETQPVSVHGLLPTITITLSGYGPDDALDIRALGGRDTVDARSLVPALIAVSIDGGEGDDTLLGNDQDNVITGGPGNDVAIMGGGNDRFVSTLDDGEDVVEGQAGDDHLIVVGSDASDEIEIAPNGPRVRFADKISGAVKNINGSSPIWRAARTMRPRSWAPMATTTLR